MAGYLNKVQLIGNLGRDPEMRQTQDGRKIATFSLATTETWKDRMTGERRERTEWHRVVIFNEKLAEIAEQYLRKGTKIYLEGQLQTRKWTDQQGVEKYTTEVVLPQFRGEFVMLSNRSDNMDAGGASAFTSQDTGANTLGAFGSTAPPSAPAAAPFAPAVGSAAPPKASPTPEPFAPSTPSQSEPELDDEVPF
ncbi:MAG: single-stranded DNA-binding protein [Pseudomonadota bacterium]